MATSRKRSRATLEDSQDEIAHREVNFTVVYLDALDKDDRRDKEENGKESRGVDSELAAKRQRTSSASDDSSLQSPPPAATPKIPIQLSPFAPTGTFQKDPYPSLDRHYKVKPGHAWSAMGKYNSFVLNTVKHFCEGFVFVANDFSLQRPRHSAEAFQPRKKSEEDWVARILEIRASDEHHVYARVYWMYWPEELPRSHYRGKVVQGRQPYHGQHELIASNHMDIINVMSVTAPAIVNQWDEQNEDDVQKALYWRQAIDVRTMELSAVEERCICGEPEHPDKTLINCNNGHCGIWLHDHCLAHNALMDTWKLLGRKKPHLSTPPIQEADSLALGRLPSPSEPGTSQAAQHSINVNPEGKSVNLFDTKAAPASTVKNEELDLKSVRTVSDVKQRRRSSAKPGARSTKSRPYLGSFEAIVANDPGKAPTIEISDLRHDVLGGDKSWKEPVRCLQCHQVIQ